MSLVETQHADCTAVREVVIRRQEAASSAPRWSFLPDSAGGAVHLPASGAAGSHLNRVLTWHLHNHNDSSLQLTEVALGAGQIGTAVRLEIPGQTFPALAASVVDGGVCVYLLLHDKALGVLQLPLSSRQQRLGGSILDGVQGGSLQVLHAPAQLAPLGSPTCMTVAGGHLVLGGTLDAVVCIPFDASGNLAVGQALQLPTSSSLLQRLVGSLMSPSQRIGTVAALQAPGPGGRQVLLLVHDDCSVRAWDVATQQPLASDDLRPDSGSASLTPRNAVVAVAERKRGGQVVLLAELEPQEGGPSVWVACTFSDAHGGRWGPSSRVQLQVPAQRARLLSAAVDGDKLWALCEADGRARVLAFSVRDGSYQGAARLLQGEGADGDVAADEDLWEATLAQFSSHISAESHVLSQLLTPGQLCRASLRDALARNGAHVSQAQVSSMAASELQAYIRAAVKTIAAKHPTLSGARCWRMFFQSYLSAWQQRHAPIALLTRPGSSWLGCMRSGPLITVLRSAVGPELLQGQSRPGVGIGDGVDAGVVRIQACLEGLRRVLGQHSLQAFTKLVMAGVDISSELLPRFIDLIVYGPLPPPAGDDAARRRMAAWRQQRQQVLFDLQTQLNDLAQQQGDPLAAVRAYAAQVSVNALSQTNGLPATQSHGQRSQQQGPSLAEGATTCSTALQIARAQCNVTQLLLLLLGLVQTQGRIGATPLTPQQRQEISDVLLPGLTATLLSAALALWLCKTPASAPVGGATQRGDEAVASMSLLQLGTPAGTPRASPREPGGQGAGQQQRQQQQPLQWPLALHLLPRLLKAQPELAFGQASCADAGAALAAFLANGPPIEATTSSSGDEADAAGDSIATRALRVGHHLYAAKEFGALEPLVQLAGGHVSGDAGLSFLSGLGIIRRLRSQRAEVSGTGSRAGAEGKEGASAAQAAMEVATGHLFRAAAGLAQPGGAALRQVLHSLQEQQRGGGAARPATQQQQLLLTGAPAGVAAGVPADVDEGRLARSEPQLRLEFFEAVMQLFEHEACAEGALAFARAAVAQVAAAYGAAQQQERQQREGRLWSSIFAYACELGRFADAYDAVTYNPQPDDATKCAKRLVHTLCEQQSLDILTSLPWAGVIAHPGGRGAAISLLQIALDVLTARALHAEVAAAPQAYKVLYAFLVRWGGYQQAAVAMLGLARRLRAEGPAGEATVEEVQHAYGATIALLELLDPTDAWLDGDEELLRHFPLPTQQAAMLQLAPQASSHSTHGAGHADLEVRAVLTVTDVRREAAVFMAAAQVASALPGLDVLRSQPSGGYVYDQLLLLGRFKDSIKLAHVLWHGQKLTSALQRAFVAMAAQCVRLQVGTRGPAAEDDMNEDAGAAPAAGELLSQPGTTYAGPSCLASPAAAAWQRLRTLLERYDGPNGCHHGLLRVAVADAALQESQGITLPPWLLQLLGSPPVAAGAEAGAPAGSMAGTAADPAALLRVYLKHRRLEDAAELVLEHLEAWQSENVLRRAVPAATWLPVQAIERLHVALADAVARARSGGRGAAAVRFSQLLRRLVDAAAEHVHRAGTDSAACRAAPAAAAPAPSFGGFAY